MRENLNDDKLVKNCNCHNLYQLLHNHFDVNNLLTFCVLVRYQIRENFGLIFKSEQCLGGGGG